MPRLLDASPQISVRLYKSIERKTVDGKSGVSARYQSKDEYIDLTPYLNNGSAVRTSKNVREPAGTFSITFADKPNSQSVSTSVSLESVYALVEPMDMVEIRMWSGIGVPPAKWPIKMRGFVSEVSRSQAVDQEGRPIRQVIITGHDYGKIWQMYKVIHLAAYSQNKPLLTSYAMWEMFGIEAQNTLPASGLVKMTVEKILNPFLQAFMPAYSPMPKSFKLDVSVAHGVVNNSYQNMQDAIYDILKFNGDVGVWNELYVEDREDGVYCVYRPIPALHITKQANAKDRRIQDDAPEPVIVPMDASTIKSLSAARTDATLANFYWVNNSRYDLIDDMQRKLASIPQDDGKVSIKDYPNSAVKYYAVRPMYAETQMGDDAIVNGISGLPESAQNARSGLQESWLDKRRDIMKDMNKDNVVLERGAAVVKGGPVRQSGESMKAGDYVRFKTGQIESLAYVVQIDDEFMPFQGYTTTLSYERGENFVDRARMEDGAESPWLAEQATNRSGVTAI